MICYNTNKRTGEVKEDEILYDEQLIFHLDANGYGVYGISKVNGYKIHCINKNRWAKMTWKTFKDEINNFILTNK